MTPARPTKSLVQRASNEAVPRPSTVLFAPAPQETILSLLGEYLEVGAVVWAGGFVRILEDLGYTDGSARIALNRVVARGLLERTRRGRLIFYGATPRLLRIIEDGRRQTYYFQQKPENSEMWTLVWYAIPHELRAPRRRLARRLSFLGFGLAEDGLWILPRDRSGEVEIAVRELGMTEYVDIYLIAAERGPQANGPLMRTWDLERIGSMYEEFISTFSSFARVSKVSKLNDRDAFVARTNVVEAFRQLASIDPRLPDATIGRKWHREEAIELFSTSTSLLAESARRHFLNQTASE
jgi:phenylacetic acid degradation operon negative regulatory protein